MKPTYAGQRVMNMRREANGAGGQRGHPRFLGARKWVGPSAIQNVNRHLVPIVELAHHDEDLGPFPAIEGETRVVEDRVGLEQVAVGQESGTVDRKAGQQGQESGTGPLLAIWAG